MSIWGSDDLVEFIRCQLDEDERVARQLIASPGGFYLEAETEQTDLMAAGAHVFRWSPARVLREVEAKRRILADYERYAAERRRAMNGWETSREVSPILTALALPCVDRDGYLEEWRP